MNRRRCAAVLLGYAATLLAAGCGPGSGSSSGSGSSTSSASSPSAVAVVGNTSEVTSAPSATDGHKPCSRPTAMSGIFKLDSAVAAGQGGGTRLSVTIVSCTVDPVNDEDVDYAPIRDATVQIRPGAQIQVLTPENNLQSVAGSWFLSHQVVNTPYFYYQDDAQGEITAMQEIYHP